MKLLEHETKQIFSKYGIPVPRGGVATSKEEVKQIASGLNYPLAIKAQVLVGGRGKAGGIKFASNEEEVESLAKKLLGSKIAGEKVLSVLVEEKVPVEKQIYFGITVDRTKQCYVALASQEGGVDIEEIAEQMPQKIVKLPIDPLYGFLPYHARQLAKKIGYKGKQMLSLASIFSKLYKLAMDYDAELAEMNPLMEKPNKEFVAVDAKLIIDDSSLYRHPEFKERVALEELSLRELKAREKGLAYVELEGDIGVIGNGAGLVMATLDTIQLQGGRPANFLDVGGGASAEKVASALEIVSSNPRVKVIFINILGGITRCDEVARGIIRAREQVGLAKPTLIRLVGTNEKEGRRILREAGIQVLKSMEEAARRAVEISRR